MSVGVPFCLGSALAKRGGKIVVARDVRLHSPDIERQLCKGLTSANCSVWLTGVLPTPALAYIASCERADYAVMITASHNPPNFNGLKVFGKSGGKLSPADEEALDGEVAALVDEYGVDLSKYADESRICANSEYCAASALSEEEARSALGLKAVNHRIRIAKNAEELYVGHILLSAPRLEGIKVRLDCASGCFAQLAAGVFEKLGASVRAENDVRDGACVNVGSGSTNIERFAPLVGEDEVGFAFDGDGDRVLAVADGKVYDGDAILLALSALYRIQGKLRKKFVVGTLMSNSRLEHELASSGIALLRTDVGDKNVLAALQKEGCPLGGEKSGHILMTDRGTTGDGLATALALMEVKKTFGKLPSYTPYPTEEFNICCADPRAEFDSPQFQAKLQAAHRAVAGKGRLVVRPSGTEPYIRVYTECFAKTTLFDTIRSIMED